MSDEDTERCGILEVEGIDPGRQIKITPGPNRCELNSRKHIDYHTYRKQFLSWLVNVGKDMEKAIGYSPYTVYENGYRTAAFDLWSWQNGDGYHLPPTQDDVNGYLDEMAFSDRSQATKGKIQEARGASSTRGKILRMRATSTLFSRLKATTRRENSNTTVSTLPQLMWAA